jgi:hypothetical protein
MMLSHNCYASAMPVSEGKPLNIDKIMKCVDFQGFLSRSSHGCLFVLCNVNQYLPPIFLSNDQISGVD